MENLTGTIYDVFGREPKDPSQYGPLALAYIGDNVYELVNRTTVLCEGDRKVRDLHALCSMKAKASTQARMALLLSPDFTEEEKAVYRRGRNAEVYTKAKNASITEYHEATGLEAVIGFLYLSGRYERLVTLLKTGWEKAFGEGSAEN